MNWTVEMVNNVSTKIKDVVEDFLSTTAKENYNLRDQIELAKRDWIHAHNYFQNVTDPDLIDHAIYMLEAAEAKYTYLLKRARDSNQLNLRV